MMDMFYFVFWDQRFAIHCPPGQFAKLHPIHRWPCQTAHCGQVQGELPIHRNMQQLVAASALSSARVWVWKIKTIFVSVYWAKFSIFKSLFVFIVFTKTCARAESLLWMTQHSGSRLARVVGTCSHYLCLPSVHRRMSLMSAYVHSCQ